MSEQMTDEEFDRNLIGRQLLESAKKREDAVTNYGQMAYKSIFLTNGGAILALLTILGSQNTEFLPGPMYWAFAMYCVGFITSINGQICIYRMTSNYINADRAGGLRCIVKQSDNIEEYHNREKRYVKYGERFYHAAMASITLSVLMFIVGSFFALHSIV